MVKYLIMQGPLRCKRFNSISKILREDWDSLFGDSAEGYGFYKTLEETCGGQFSFHYITIHDNSGTLLIAPLFTADLNLGITMDGPAGAVIERVRKFMPNFFVFKTLFCGSPFGEKGRIGVKKGHVEPEVIHVLTSEMEKLSRKKRARLMIFKDFPDDDCSILSPLENMGFFRTKSMPSVINEAGFKSLEEYFKSLSYTNRKDLRRKLKKARTGGEIEIKVVDDIHRVIDDVYALYMKTYLAGKIKFEKLTRDFFINIAKNMKPHAKFVLYYAGGRLGAFNLCFVYKDLLIDKFIGFDYDISYKYNLYFVSWCHNMEWCIRDSIRYYQTGQTNYKPKLSLGGKKLALYAYIKHKNILSNLALKILDGAVRS